MQLQNEGDGCVKQRRWSSLKLSLFDELGCYEEACRLVLVSSNTRTLNARQGQYTLTDLCSIMNFNTPAHSAPNTIGATENASLKSST